MIILVDIVAGSLGNTPFDIVVSGANQNNGMYSSLTTPMSEIEILLAFGQGGNLGYDFASNVMVPVLQWLDYSGESLVPGQCVQVRNSTAETLAALAIYPDPSISLGVGQSKYFTTTGGSGAGTVWSDTPCCVVEGTLVEQPLGEQARVQDLRPGDLVLDFQKRPVELERVIRFAIPRQEFIEIGALRVCRDHPVLDGDFQERPCQEIDGSAVIQLERPRQVFTLVTKEKTFVSMNGQFVGTWSERAWRLQKEKVQYDEL